MKLTDIYVYQDRSETTGELIYKVTDPSKGVRLPIRSVKPGKRFGHFILDTIIFYIIYNVLLVSFAYSVDREFLIEVVDYIVFVYLVMYFMYYFVSELLLQTTLGKIATGCKVIDVYGEKPTASQMLGRNLARYLPFEAFSCLGSPSYGWHDSLSGTYVVEKKDLEWMLKLKDEYRSEGAAAYNSLISNEF